jgi:hypothetical protein
MDYKLYHIKCRPPNVSYAKQAYILKCRNMTVERGLSLIFSSYEIAATCYPSVHRPARWLDSNGGCNIRIPLRQSKTHDTVLADQKYRVEDKFVTWLLNDDNLDCTSPWRSFERWMPIETSLFKQLYFFSK